MNHQKEKSAEVPGTPTPDSEEQCTASLSVAEKTGKQGRKEYATLQAKFALLGRVLNRIHRAHGSRIIVIYAVSHRGATRYINTMPGVLAHLAEIGGAEKPAAGGEL